MAIKGLSLVEVEPFYSSFDDAPEAEKTKWLLGPVDLMVRSYIQDNAISWVPGDGGMVMTNKAAFRNFEICRFGLKGFENFKDDKTGADIAFVEVDRALNGKTYKNVSDDVLNRIPGQVIQEIAERLIEINTATEALRKK